MGVETYAVRSDIAWVRDLDTCILVARDGTGSWVLAGEEAFIWSMLMLGHSPEGIADLLAQANETTPLEARRRLEDTLRSWAEQGILHVGVGRG